MEFTVALDSPLSVDYTLGSGQTFRWKKKGDAWYGVVRGQVLKVSQEGEALKCSGSSQAVDSGFVRDYFRLDEALDPVLESITKDDQIRAAVERFYGLRIVRQEKWECLASFLLATNANIPRIQQMVSSVSMKFGDRVEFEGGEFFSFPGPGRLAESKVSELRTLGLGYRAPFLKHVAVAVTAGGFDLEAVAKLSYEEARDSLLTRLLGEKTLLGVGPKVADCFLLYSCGMAEAFPIDVWVARALAGRYPRLIGAELRRRMARGEAAKISRRDYYETSAAARKHFGPNAGYAQIYMYMHARSGDEGSG